MQVSLTKIIHWLFTDAGAGWLAALVALAALVWQFLSRKVAEKLVFKETINQSLLIISREVEEKISITFNTTPVKQLSQLQAEITNSGSEVIRDATITVRIPHLIQLLDILVTDASGYQDFKTTPNNKEIKITIPFLNPMKPHHHIIRALFVIDGDLEGLKILGTGAGWSLRHETIEAQERKPLFTQVFLLILLVISILALIYVSRRLHIGPNEVSWRVLLLLPSFILAVIMFVVLIKDVKRTFKRLPFRMGRRWKK